MLFVIEMEGKQNSQNEAKEILEFDIPEGYYKYGKPVRTHYLSEDRKGLAYAPDPETFYEIRAEGGCGLIVISLCSPYIIGFDYPIEPKDLEVVDVDIEGRKVWLKKKEEGY